MADIEHLPLIVAGEPAGMCDPVSGVCAVPQRDLQGIGPSGEQVSSPG